MPKSLRCRRGCFARAVTRELGAESELLVGVPPLKKKGQQEGGRSLPTPLCTSSESGADSWSCTKKGARGQREKGAMAPSRARGEAEHSSLPGRARPVSVTAATTLCHQQGRHTAPHKNTCHSYDLGNQHADESPLPSLPPSLPRQNGVAEAGFRAHLLAVSLGGTGQGKGATPLP